ncbi:BTB domain containing protein [Pandoravirus quercus]|uniref:BTB domain containing protein n=1 Tax=Pandoravirus quercus TaxID=2107709 RepID=A0A2U7U8F8_9VIRU|nr:BTB domain containing protein [Pandoravirus quercus]AVK74672.1 BTB domain containing protein [Pandoravirus quercus]
MEAPSEAAKAPQLTDKIVLDIGGRIMSTTRATLTKERGSLLDRMFGLDATMPSVPDARGAHFLDCDPDDFANVLRYLRHGVVGSKAARDPNLTAVADFLGLMSLVRVCEAQASSKPSPAHSTTTGRCPPKVLDRCDDRPTERCAKEATDPDIKNRSGRRTKKSNGSCAGRSTGQCIKRTTHCSKSSTAEWTDGTCETPPRCDCCCRSSITRIG